MLYQSNRHDSITAFASNVFAVRELRSGLPKAEERSDVAQTVLLDDVGVVGRKGFMA